MTFVYMYIQHNRDRPPFANPSFKCVQFAYSERNKAFDKFTYMRLLELPRKYPRPIKNNPYEGHESG